MMKHVTGKTHNKSNTFLKAIKITKKSYILQNKCELIQLFLHTCKCIRCEKILTVSKNYTKYLISANDSTGNFDLATEESETTFKFRNTIK